MDTLEQMQVKAWLNQARPETEVRQLTNSVERLRGYQAKAAAMGRDASGDGVERYAALVAGYVSELEARAAEVRAVISQVPNETQRRVLECRYLDGMTIEQTADALSYCAKNINYHHRHALESVKSILDRMEPTPCLTLR